MNWTRLKLWKRTSPFSNSGPGPVPLEITSRQEIRLASPMSGPLPVPVPSTDLRRGRRGAWSWLGWLTGRNRRREGGDRLIQGELLLRQVRPLRNDFRDETAASPGRRNPKVLYETPPSPERRDDQDHAWNRLRNRRSTTVAVRGD